MEHGRKLKKTGIRKAAVCILAVTGILCLSGCAGKEEYRGVGHDETGVSTYESGAETEKQESGTEQKEMKPIILPEGNTLETRFDTPDGYKRTGAEKRSFTTYLRKYPLKEYGSPVLFYDGTPRADQGNYEAVFRLPLESEDLQQCADSVMRMYAEYFLDTGQYERIRFHFVGGFQAEYAKWREGYRIRVDGDQVSWVKTAAYDDSYECFQKFMRMVFAYSGTLSMEDEAKSLELGDIRPGDVFLNGGSPGHVVMIVDVCENSNGKKAFLLGQGYMPAQEFHVLKNPAHEEDPWYYAEEVTYPFITPEYTFQEGSLKRLEY